jgi:uncharacterized phage infection (PIP) family protein YhgE
VAAPPIEDILGHLAQVLDATRDPAQRDALTKIQADVRDFAQERSTERDRLQAIVTGLQAQVTQGATTIAQLNQTIATQAAEIEPLKAQAASMGDVTQSTPLDIAKSFREVMESIQGEARNAPGVGTTIKGLEIEVKGLVQVTDNATNLVLPNIGTVVDSNALSTLRVSFGAVPVVAPATPAVAAPSSSPTTLVGSPSAEEKPPPAAADRPGPPTTPPAPPGSPGTG